MSGHAAWTEQALGGLRDAGLRKGGARHAVVEHLGKQRCCLSAQEIFDGIRADGGRVGIASVYRAVDQLADLRLVQRVDIGDGVARYEPAHSGGDHHHHLVCDDCGKVEAFSDPALEQALERVAGTRGYEMDAHEVVLHGACSSCLQAGRRFAKAQESARADSCRATPASKRAFASRRLGIR